MLGCSTGRQVNILASFTFMGVKRSLTMVRSLNISWRHGNRVTGARSSWRSPILETAAHEMLALWRRTIGNPKRSLRAYHARLGIANTFSRFTCFAGFAEEKTVYCDCYTNPQTRRAVG